MLKIGVIGAGERSKTHVCLLKEIGSYELIGFYDPSKKTADLFSKELGIKAKFDLATKKVMMYQADPATKKFPETSQMTAEIVSFK